MKSDADNARYQKTEVFMIFDIILSISYILYCYFIGFMKYMLLAGLLILEPTYSYCMGPMNFSQTYDEHPPDRDHGPTVLIIDDEELGRDRMRNLCAVSNEASRIRLLEASTVQEALSILTSTTVQVIILDKVIRNRVTGDVEDGIASIPEILKLQPHAQILVVTSSDEQGDAVQAMAAGAFWFLNKMTPNPIVLAQINRAIEISGLISFKLRTARNGGIGRSGSLDLAGRSKAVAQLKEQIRAVSQTNHPVLLLGETGTGKTTSAKLIHDYRQAYLKQSDRPWFAVNMGAISPELAERELFGNEKGAYTDAHTAKPGLFELANNGTLFLDEIGEAPLSLQVKLLKVIEEGAFMRLGGTQIRRTSFKLICATNRNLSEMLASGEFREDLYFRISTFPIVVPSLAQRMDDIPDIIRSLLPKVCADVNVQVTYDDLPADFLETLICTPTRGNIRGIEQQLARLLVLAPRDNRGRPILAGWRDINGLGGKRLYSIARRDPISVKELLSRPLEVQPEDFPGIGQLQDILFDKAMLSAMQQHKKVKDIASVLRIPISRVSTERRRLLAKEGAKA